MKEQLRPLGPQVLLLLGQLPNAALPQSVFAPAAFLLDELQCSLTTAQARARRPAFLNTVPSQQGPGRLTMSSVISEVLN